MTPMMMNISNPYQDQFRQQLPFLLEHLDLSGGAMAAPTDAAEEPYVQVVPQWWGLVFVLSNKAAQDLATGSTGVSGVAGVIAAICAANPALLAAGLVAGLIASVLGLYTGIYASLNRGNGIYITALWGVIPLPHLWIPTTR